MRAENYNIVYAWWCNICRAFHYYPEDCPFDDTGYNEEEEYYYGIR